MKFVAAAAVWSLLGATGARAQADLLATPECRRARSALDAAFDAVAQKRRDAAAQLRLARERAAQACFGTTLAGTAADAAGAASGANAASPPASSARGALPASAQTTAPRVASPEDLQLRPALTLTAPKSREAPPPVVPPPSRSTVTQCDTGGCWDNLGRRINQVGPTLVGPNGPCTVQGVFATCP